MEDEISTEKMKTPFSEMHHTRMGPVLGILIILLVLILGGLYLWGATLSNDAETPTERIIPNNEPETPRAEADKQIFGTVSPSDELSAIDTDLESTNLDSLDPELDQAGRELDSALQSPY